MNGILNVYKPQGLSSHAVVNRVRKFTDTRRVGHAGTLDPMACGVLPVLVGSAASIQELIMDHRKTYVAGVRFGVTTDTGDVTGKVLAEKKPSFTEKQLEELLPRFTGEIEQIPPMYSALQKDGVRLYDLARQGLTVEREARKITVDSLRVVSPFDGKRAVLEVSCSRGTYIRTLAGDIGEALGCGACLDFLERTVCGDYRKENAVTVVELEQYYQAGTPEKIENLLISPETLFMHLPAVRLAPFFERLALCGAEIYLKKARIKAPLTPENPLCRVYDESGRFLAVARLGMYENGEAVKLVYRFV